MMSIDIVKAVIATENKCLEEFKEDMQKMANEVEATGILPNIPKGDEFAIGMFQAWVTYFQKIIDMQAEIVADNATNIKTRLERENAAHDFIADGMTAILNEVNSEFYKIQYTWLQDAVNIERECNRKIIEKIGL